MTLTRHQRKVVEKVRAREARTPYWPGSIYRGARKDVRRLLKILDGTLRHTRCA